ncbi:hypothetical protein I4U23_016741, partial [Adineta vaga]
IADELSHDYNYNDQFRAPLIDYCDTHDIKLYWREIVKRFCIDAVPNPGLF